MLKADLRINLHNQSVLPISYYTFVYIRYTNLPLAQFIPMTICAQPSSKVDYILPFNVKFVDVHFKLFLSPW